MQTSSAETLAINAGIFVEKKPEKPCLKCVHLYGFRPGISKLEAIMGTNGYSPAHRCKKAFLGFDLVEGREHFASCVTARLPQHCGPEGKWFELIEASAIRNVIAPETTEIVFDKIALASGKEAAAQRVQAMKDKRAGRQQGLSNVNATDL